MEDLINILNSYTLSFTSEAELQEAIAAVLTLEGKQFTREVELSQEDRIDFLLDGGIGIEVKTKGTLTNLTRQIFRYAESPLVTSILVVCSLNRLAKLPNEINGKPSKVLVVGVF